MKVYCHVLTWNDHRYLPELFASFDAQTYRDFSVRVLDNGSNDKTVEYLQEHVPQTLVGHNVRNLGFAEGHNQLVRFTLEHQIGSEVDPYILIMNSDMILHKDAILHLVEALNAHPEWSAVQPKVYRAFREQTGDEHLKETILSDILDTTGLRVHKGWRMADRGAGEMDSSQYDTQIDLFGPAGAIFMIRLSALKELFVNAELFDREFFSYREDCDLAWRMAGKRMKTGFVPLATLHHYRGMYGAEHVSLWKRLRNRQGQRPFLAALSTRNQLFMLLKNLSWSECCLSFPWIFWNEGIRVCYGFLFEPETRRGLFGMWKMIPSMLSKRKTILRTRIATRRELRSYVV